MRTFEDRCQSDPQGVIVDLIKQTKRQAKTIYTKSEQIKEFEKENKKLKKKLDKLSDKSQQDNE